jgi:hypothetical protein
LRKCAYLVSALAVVLVGCAGGGAPAPAGGGGGGGGGGGAGGSRVNLNGASGTIPPGLLDVYLLPGQSRAPGSKTVDIDVMRFLAGSTQAEDALAGPIRLKLDAFNVQSRAINTDNGQSLGSRPSSITFDSLEMSFQQMFREDDGGNQVSFAGQSLAFPGNFQVTTFPGRVTAVQLFMNDAMVDETTNAGGNVTGLNFNEAAFIAANTNPETGKITGFLSDYVAFDLSAIPPSARPTMLSDGGAGRPASFVYLSGDSYALSEKDPKGVNGSNGVFEVLTKFGTFEGFFRPMDATTQRKTYELKQADPSVVPDLRLITALKGIYRDSSEVLANLGTFEFITLPKSTDGPRQEIAVFTRTGTSITAMWFGTADFATKTFRVYPIRNVQPASTVGELRGTFSNFLDKNGAVVNTGAANWWRAVRSGTYTFNAGATGIPAGNVTGRFLVFRGE